MVVVGVVGLLLWKVGTGDWRRVAGLTAGSLAEAVESEQPLQHRDELFTRAIQLRTETVDATAVPDATHTVAASWTYLGAAEDLIRTLVRPQGNPIPAGQRSELAQRLRTIEAQCFRQGAPNEIPASAPRRATTQADLDVVRMAMVVEVLRGYT